MAPGGYTALEGSFRKCQKSQDKNGKNLTETQDHELENWFTKSHYHLNAFLKDYS